MLDASNCEMGQMAALGRVVPEEPVRQLTRALATTVVDHAQPERTDVTDSAVTVHAGEPVAPVRRRIFGSFVEHLGRCVYDGIYEPGHATADQDGFRSDIVELVKELGTTTIRYPGGNFVSGYRWEDGVGPRDRRPRRRDLAWHSTETNQVGIDEFARWAKLVDAEIMLAVNLGTRGILEALDLLEYVNGEPGTALADQRVGNGIEQPYGVRMWCLGNEMDGPWQIGHLTAEQYGSIAARTAAAMKAADPSLELVVCGSSSSAMPTFGAWERTVLEQAYDHVDFVSCHAYYQEHDGDLASFLVSSVNMEYFIRSVVAAADHAQQLRHGTRQIHISFDEWNVWYQSAHEREEARAREEAESQPRPWPVAPRLLEDVYNVADAVVVGSLLITLLKNSDRVRSASLAQLVNVIAPIRCEPAGPAWRQTIFYPFAITSRLAAGDVLRVSVDTPLLTTKAYGDVPALDAVATYDPAHGRGAVFLVNRSVGDAHTVTLDVGALSDVSALRIIETLAIHDDDPYVSNTSENEYRVVPQPLETTVDDTGNITMTVPPVSWVAVAFAHGTS
jgi:alpha-N-arabinofuranosidase